MSAPPSHRPAAVDPRDAANATVAADALRRVATRQSRPAIFSRTLGSIAGTRVNGQRCTIAVLSPGDVIEFGGTRFRFGVDTLTASFGQPGMSPPLVEPR